MTNIFECGKLKDKYERIESIGEGGNAQVFLVREILTGMEYALKPLKESYARNSKNPEKRERFKKEIEVVNELKEKILGIIPIIEYEIDDENKTYWYTMPIATEIWEELRNRNYNYEFIVKGIIELAETLAQIHNHNRSHRDIKPENIYYYNDRFYIGDFGLVSFLDDEISFTEPCALGAYSTMAPEMRRDPHKSDGKKADVYSLAKTLWIMLTKKEKGFDGVYNFNDKKIGLRYDSIVSKIHIVELEELLHNATDNDPDKRPSMLEFKQQLQLWLDMNPQNWYSDKVQTSEWRFINNYLFGNASVYVPEIAEWREKNKIREILSLIASLPAFNHMMYMKGGLDFIGTEDANEDGCLYLYEDGGFSKITNIVKPHKLIYCNFLEDTRWNYFLLELAELNPILDSETPNQANYEFLVEDTPGHYVSGQYSQYGVYDYDSGKELPDGWKEVRRCNNGKYLICMKFGPYNNISATYDGRHTQCSAEKFREYISCLLKTVSKYVKKGYDEETVLNSQYISKNPFVSPKTEDNQLKKSINVDAEDYFKEHYQEWNFQKQIVFSSSSELSHTKFWIVYEKNKCILDSLDSKNLSKKKIILCEDGIFKSEYTEDEILYFNDYEDAKQTEENIEKEIRCIAESNYISLKECNLYITIKHKFENIVPKHLFTKEEIEKLMRNADDRHNNVLVINTDGYAEIIQDDIEKAHHYPVRHESWNVGNKYVGKYSNLSTLDEDYITSLQGWLIFLKSHKHVYMDYVHENNNEDELIEEINYILNKQEI